jgi:DNA-binding NtrC family response regulator
MMTATNEATLNAASILIIEDDPRQLGLYAKALRDYRLSAASSAAAALESLQRGMPDLIILDHVLEGSVRGLDFLPRLKTVASHVPVIVISGSLDVKQQLAALSGPRSAHYALEKPVDIDELERTVEIALTECGMGEVVSWLQALEKMDKVEGDEPDRRFTERLVRQHEMLKCLRQSGQPHNVSQFSRQYQVSRKTIIRDIRELIHRGQLDPSAHAVGESDGDGDD